MLISLLAAGAHGAIGAALGMALVVVFFAAGQWAISWAADNMPDFLMPAALGTYLVQILLVAVAAGALRHVTFMEPRAFGFTALACTLVWMAGQIRGLVKSKMFYVEPESGTGSTASKPSADDPAKEPAR
ncbi:hypothetical protein [Mangrovactinospora gilvigrisea]|nr:hypothetical protein [Mangrovactinospora gilvigrisea]